MPTAAHVLKLTQYFPGNCSGSSVRQNRRCCQAAAAIVTAPSATKPVPIMTEPVNRGGTSARVDIVRRNKPKRATTNPMPITAMPVRNHANSVRSDAKKIRGSTSLDNLLLRFSEFEEVVLF